MNILIMNIFPYRGGARSVSANFNGWWCSREDYPITISSLKDEQSRRHRSLCKHVVH